MGNCFPFKQKVEIVTQRCYRSTYFVRRPALFYAVLISSSIFTVNIPLQSRAGINQQFLLVLGWSSLISLLQGSNHRAPLHIICIKETFIKTLVLVRHIDP
jgi:hypothetical protein